MVKIDITKTGLEMLFKDWQMILVELLMGERHTTNNPLRSREAWIYANEHLPEGRSISRASVIFFMQDLVEAGWLNTREETGRGGHHGVYWKKAPLGEIVDNLSDKLVEKLQSLQGKVNE